VKTKIKLKNCKDDGSASGIESVDYLGDCLATDGALSADDFSALVAHAAMATRDEHCVDLVCEAHFA